MTVDRNLFQMSQIQRYDNESIRKEITNGAFVNKESGKVWKIELKIEKKDIIHMFTACE